MSIEQQAKGKKEGDIRYLTPLNIDTNKNKKSGFYHLFEFKAPGDIIESFEVEFRRDERVMRYLTVRLEKEAIAWAEKRRAKLNSKKA